MIVISGVFYAYAVSARVPCQRINPGTIVPISTSSRGLVLVTGGSGYIAGYCVAQLLNDGWNVRTTVRDVAKTKAARASMGNIAPKAAEIEFVEADLNSDAGWDRAAIGAQHVLHVASPVPVTDPKSDDELVRPARDGTVRVLRAARDAGVKRVVMTSSISAIIYGRGVRDKPFTVNRRPKLALTHF